MIDLEKVRREFIAKRREWLADLACQFIDGSSDESMGALEELMQARRAAQNHKRNLEPYAGYPARMF